MNYTNIDRIGRRLFRYPIYNFLKLFSTTNMPEASDEPIDVIIPIIAKDLVVLPLCIEGIKKNVPVSYTHLDVYKRQVSQRIERR